MLYSINNFWHAYIIMSAYHVSWQVFVESTHKVDGSLIYVSS